MGMRALSDENRRLVEASRKKIEESKPPPLEKSIFPSRLRVRKFVPGTLLSIHPEVEKRTALPVIGFGLILSWIMMALTGIPLALLLSLAGHLSTSLVSGLQTSWVSALETFCNLVALVAGPVILYLLLTRRSFVTMNFATKKMTSFLILSASRQPLDSMVLFEVKPADRGFRGELRMKGFILVRTDVVPTEQEARQQLMPFAAALNNAIGQVARH